MKRRVRTQEDGGEEREIQVKRQAKGREWLSGESERKTPVNYYNYK